MELEGSLLHLQVPATCPHLEPARSNPCFHIPLSEDQLNIILPFTPGSPKWSLSLRFPHQNTIRLSTHPYALYASPVSLFSIWSPGQQWMSSTDHKAAHVVFSTPLLPRPSWAQIFSTPYFQTHSTQQNNYCHKKNFTETNFYLILQFWIRRSW